MKLTKREKEIARQANEAWDGTLDVWRSATGKL